MAIMIPEIIADYPDLVRIYSNFILPFDPLDYQIPVFERAKNDRKHGLWLGTGLGKTFLATLLGLHCSLVEDAETLLFIVPAPIVTQWAIWLNRIKTIDGDALEVLAYQGNYRKRDKMSFNADCVVMSHNVFRDDYDRIANKWEKSENVVMIYDEAHMGLRRIGNAIYEGVEELAKNKRLYMLTATPISNPDDAYGIIKQLDPTIYSRQKVFERMHAGDRDFYDRVTEWFDLDTMHDNLYKHATKLEASEVRNFPKAKYVDVVYDLLPSHKKVYDDLIRKKLLELDDGRVLSGLEAAQMFHLAQQFVVAPAKLNVARINTNLFNICKTIFMEDSSKMLVFSKYRNSNEMLLEMFNKAGIPAVGYWGVHSDKQKEEAKRQFINNDDVGVCVGNPASLGVGVDGLQYVCHRELFVEMPVVGRDFYQAVGRVNERTGQTEKCIIKCLLARGTIQQYIFDSLMKKDDIVSQVTGSIKKLFDIFNT